MLQLVYVSTVRNVDGASIDDVLAVSRINNRRDGITGLLHFNGKRFLQALEGEPAMVEAAFARIGGDPRHFALVVLSRRTIATREFGDWAMAHPTTGEGHAAFVARISRLVEGAAPGVRGTFEGFVGLRAA